MTESFSEQDDVDALTVLGFDVDEQLRDAELTATAYRALADLTVALQAVCEGKGQVSNAPALLEQIRRLAHIVEDYYAAHPQR